MRINLLPFHERSARDYALRLRRIRAAMAYSSSPTTRAMAEADHDALIVEDRRRFYARDEAFRAHVERRGRGVQ